MVFTEESQMVHLLYLCRRFVPLPTIRFDNNNNKIKIENND